MNGGNKRKIILISFAVIFCVLVGLNVIFVGKIRSLSIDIRDILIQTSQAKESQKSITARQDQYLKYEEFFRSLEERYIDPEIPRNFVNFLQDEAKKYGISMKIVASELRKEDGIIKFGLQISGSYQSCFSYVSFLERSPWFIEIGEIKGATKGGKDVEMSLTILAKIKK